MESIYDIIIFYVLSVFFLLFLFLWIADWLEQKASNLEGVHSGGFDTLMTQCLFI